MARKKTTGRFKTRAELETHILFLWKTTTCSQAQVARNCDVSQTTVANILALPQKG